MTTPTEELDRDYFAKKLRRVLRDMDDYTPDELSRELGRLSETASPAFREAVEAESDAERMKQPAVARFQKSGDYYQHVTDDEEYIKTLDIDMSHTFPLYAQPFPSTEQLQQRVKELEDAAKRVLASPYSKSGIEFINAMRGLEKALANTQGDSK